MQIKYKIVATPEELIEATAGWSGKISCDVETKGKLWDKDGKLLGVALSPEDTGGGYDAVYVCYSSDIVHSLRVYVGDKRLVGHNFTYDKAWVDKTLEVQSTWEADTRIMWHLSSAPAGPRPYGLKNAQKDILSWEATNEEELEKEVRAKGGSLKNGDHWMASVETLGKYACLDAYATMQLYKRFEHFFDMHNYWDFLHKMMSYNLLLSENWVLGVPVDVEGLKSTYKRLTSVKNAAKNRLERQLRSYVQSLESDWVAVRSTKYKRESARELFLSDPGKWKRFNWNSDADKRELFYHTMKNQVVYETESGKPAVDADSIKQMEGPWKEAYLKYERANTLVSNFVGPYVDSSSDGVMHPGFNICGTVSYRLSGFKPYLLNAPFDEKSVMKHFKCPPGYTGIHMDFAAVEPTMTAHFSEDPYLLKVFRDGLGDIYLDLALDLFPEDKELHCVYNPRVPVTSDTKQRLSKQRKVAKVIQLAVQYTGTGKTVSRNLTKEGVPTPIDKAKGYVSAYWRKFRRVAEWQYQLREVNRKDRLLRNVVGRIIRVPDPDYKDLPNRFIQSSAHDCLILFVLELDKLRKEYNLDMRPLLVDCHDSTSWVVKTDQVRAGEHMFKLALERVNAELDLAVPLRMDMKRFRTMAGLKQEEK